MDDVKKLTMDPAINDLVVRITTAAVMCLDADEDNTVRLAAFERGIVQDIDRFRTAALTTASAEAETEKRVLEAALNQNDAMRQELAHIGNLVSDLARTMGVE